MVFYYYFYSIKINCKIKNEVKSILATKNKIAGNYLIFFLIWQYFTLFSCRKAVALHIPAGCVLLWRLLCVIASSFWRKAWRGAASSGVKTGLKQELRLCQKHRGPFGCCLSPPAGHPTSVLRPIQKNPFFATIMKEK